MTAKEKKQQFENLVTMLYTRIDGWEDLLKERTALFESKISNVENKAQAALTAANNANSCLHGNGHMGLKTQVLIIWVVCGTLLSIATTIGIKIIFF